MRIVYVSGPMTGLVNHNIPSFRLAEARLQKAGYATVNPANLHEESKTGTLEHHEYLRTDIAALINCDAIYMLPGWAHSKGASVELVVAKACNIERLADNTIDVEGLGREY